MPFTLAHPAAVLPLRRFPVLQTVPLIIGSLVPDAPYFMPQRLGRYLTDTHTFAGSLFADLPFGLLLLALVVVLREPLTAPLSGRARWLALSALQPFLAARAWQLAPLSVLLGVWTHIAWDSFTHPGGWIALRVAALNAPVLIFGWKTELSHLLQYVSSLFGLIVLAIWLRHQLARVPSSVERDSLHARWLLLIGVAAAALAIGGARGLSSWHDGSYYHLTFLLLTRVIGWFGALYLTAGLAVSINRRPQPEPAG
jgi:hypothetical protein